jgi:hypothetical protein
MSTVSAHYFIIPVVGQLYSLTDGLIIIAVILGLIAPSTPVTLPSSERFSA